MFALDALTAELEQDITSWSIDQLGDGLRRVGRLRAALDACEGRLLVAFDRAKGAQRSGAADTASWLRSETGVTHREAARSLARARGLAELPGAAEALARGELTGEHASALARAARSCPSVAAQHAALVDDAVAMPADQFERHLRAWTLEHQRDGGATELERQRARRRATTFTTDEGMVALDVRLDPVAGATVVAQLDRVAEELWRADHPGAADNGARQLDLPTRRADAIVEVCRRAASVDPTTARRPTPTVIVLVDHQTLLGQLAEHGVSELADGTPIAAPTARRLACEAGILPMVLSSEGVPLDLGRTQRVPSPGQRKALIVRDGGCVFPGCNRPWWWCDAHHRVPWEHGQGPTDLANLDLVCDHHHHLLHEGGWRLERHHDRSVTAVGPDGTVRVGSPRARGAPSSPGPEQELERSRGDPTLLDAAC